MSIVPSENNHVDSNTINIRDQIVDTNELSPNINNQNIIEPNSFFPMSIEGNNTHSEKISKAFNAVDIMRVFWPRASEGNIMKHDEYETMKALYANNRERLDDRSFDERKQDMVNHKLAGVPMDIKQTELLDKHFKDRNKKGQRIFQKTFGQNYTRLTTAHGTTKWVASHKTVEEELSNYLEIASLGKCKSTSTINTLSDDEEKVLKFCKKVQLAKFKTLTLVTQKQLLHMVGNFLVTEKYLRSVLNSVLELFELFMRFANSPDFELLCSEIELPKNESLTMKKILETPAFLGDVVKKCVQLKNTESTKFLYFKNLDQPESKNYEEAHKQNYRTKLVNNFADADEFKPLKLSNSQLKIQKSLEPAKNKNSYRNNRKIVSKQNNRSSKGWRNNPRGRGKRFSRGRGSYNRGRGRGRGKRGRGKLNTFTKFNGSKKHKKNL